MVIVDFALRPLAPPLHAPAHQRLMDLIKVSVRPSSMLTLCPNESAPDLMAEYSAVQQSSRQHTSSTVVRPDLGMCTSREEFLLQCGCGLQYLPVILFK